MNCGRLICVVLFGWCFMPAVMAQVVEEPWVPLRLEEMDESDALRYYEMQDTEIRPVHVNRAEWFHLMEIPGMDEQWAHNIIAFRDSVGHFFTLYEILSVRGITREYLQGVQHWFRVSPQGGATSHTASVRWVTKGSFTATAIPPGRQPLGSSHKVVLRYRYEHNNWGFNIKGEKDAGEPFGGPLRPEGFDFYSGWIRYQGSGAIRQLIVGDYRVSVGHGLLCNQLFAAGNNASLLYQPHEHRVARPHTSMDEHHFFRGAAITLRHLPVDVTLFGSAKPLDGNITRKDSTSGKALAVSSIQKSGIHATPSEIRNRHAFTEYAAGAGIRFVKREWHTALHLLHIHYSAMIEPSSTFANTHRFRGNRTTGASLFTGWYNEKIGMNLEVSVSDARPAISQVIVINADGRSTIWFSTRYFSPWYFAPYANTLSRTTSPTGEKGINMVYEYRPRFVHAIRAIVDMGQILYTAQAPASGRHFSTLSLESTRMEKSFNSLVRITRDIRSESSFIPLEADNRPLVNNIEQIRHMARGTVTMRPNEALQLYLRVDYRLKSSSEPEEGWMVVAGVTGRTHRNKISIAFRHAIFRTDSYDTRVFSHEQDAPGAFSMYMHYGQGSRTYLMLRINPNRNIRIWIKAGYTSFTVPNPTATKTQNWDIGTQINYTR